MRESIGIGVHGFSSQSRAGYRVTTQFDYRGQQSTGTWITTVEKVGVGGWEGGS